MQSKQPQFDLHAAHRHFSADCFNRTWTLLDKPHRSAAEDQAMVLCAMASLWHWTQRADCTGKNLSVGHWQVSRAYALAGQGENAMRHARESLKHSDGLQAFTVGYAHEALARAALVLNDKALGLEHLKLAKAFSAQVADEQDRGYLDADLKSLESACGSTVQMGL